MRIALMTDIHGNREAFAACLAHADGKVDRYVLLGDFVGYGADPGWVVDTVVRMVDQGAVALIGNHDAAVERGGGGMNDDAKTAIEWTARQLDTAQRRFLAHLPLGHEEEGRLYVHANAHAPEKWGYVTSSYAASQSFAASDAQAIFCGHVHVPALYHLSVTGKLAAFDPPAATAMPLTRQRRWLAVIGAVGQPRDRNPAACYAVIDTDEPSLTYHRVPYDIDAAAQKIRSAGLPANLAFRLYSGQ